MVKEEKRSHVRENFSFKVKFRTLTREEYDSIKQNAHKPPAADSMRYAAPMRDGDELNSDIVFNSSMVDFLLQMDDKLDRILALLSNDKEDSHSVLSEGLGQNMSGSGMNILTDRLIEPKAIVHANLFLSRYPVVFIDLFGEVVRVKPLNEDGKKKYCLGIKFIDLDSDDRDRIVACVFQWQREGIRKRKSELDDGNAAQ